MIMRLFIAAIVIVAIIFGVFSLMAHGDNLVRLIKFRDFFDASIPILAFGALIKYLCCCNK